MCASVTSSYHAHDILWTQRVNVSWLDELSERDVTAIRTEFKNLTFATRSTGDEVDNRLLVELTDYMARRFPKCGSTPTCEAVRPMETL
jgi:hypothetical protein